MLFDAGPEAEMRPFGVQNHAEQFRTPPVHLESFLQCGDHVRVDDVPFGTRETQPQQLLVVLQPRVDGKRDADAHGLPSAFGRRLSTSESLHAVPCAISLRKAMKSISRCSRGPSLKARKPVRASASILSASHAREFSLF